MISNAAIRKNARMQLKGNWGNPILVGVLYFLITIVISLISFYLRKSHASGFSTFALVIVSSLISGPLMIGLNVFSLKLMHFRLPEAPTS